MVAVGPINSMDAHAGKSIAAQANPTESYTAA